MQTYKLKGIDIYIVNVFSIEEAVFIAWKNKIGVVEENLELCSFEVDREAGYGEVFRSYEELKKFL